MASTVPSGTTQSHSGGREPKKVKVRLTIEEVDTQTGKVTRFSSKQESGEPCDDGKGNLNFKDKTKWNAAVRIEFKIKNDSGCTMAFAADPLWVAAGSECPQGPSSQPDFEVIPPVGELELTVLDKNETIDGYGYTLRFQSTESKTGFFLLDPIITNGGGGIMH
jgi:hypothetical protein